MKEYPYYYSRSNCSKIEKMNPVCICPSGFTDYLCQTEEPKMCHVQITNPNLAYGCQDEDSFDYVYQIKGFDPCFYFDFKKPQHELQYKLNCQAVDSQGLVLRGGHPEKVGFNYTNVIDNGTQRTPEFNYFAENKETGLKLMEGNSVTLVFYFQDWLYLTKNITFKQVITDNDILVGKKEGTLPFNFQQLVNMDEQGLSKFEVAGRVYFESHVLGFKWRSYSTNGFFDREGYEEPIRDDVNFPVYWYAILAIVCLLFFSAIVCYCLKQRRIRIENEKLEDLQKRTNARNLRSQYQQNQ